MAPQVHLSSYHHSHRDNVTAPTGRPKLRRRLPFSHREGGGRPRILRGHVVALGGNNVGTVLRDPRLCAEKLNNYWRLIILIFIFTVCIGTLFYLVDFYCLYINLIFNVIIGKCFSSWNPHCRWENSPNALLVQLYEQRTVAVTVHLHLYFHSVHNLSLYTVCNSSTGWCAGRIKLLTWYERRATDHIKRLFS